MARSRSTLPAAAVLLLLVAVSTHTATAAATAQPYYYSCGKDALPRECAAEEFSHCYPIPFPFSVVFGPGCSKDDKVKACCDALKKMHAGGHECAKCALLKEVEGFDLSQCKNGVQDASAHCKHCEQNPGDDGCKDA